MQICYFIYICQINISIPVIVKMQGKRGKTNIMYEKQGKVGKSRSSKTISGTMQIGTVVLQDVHDFYRKFMSHFRNTFVRTYSDLRISEQRLI